MQWTCNCDGFCTGMCRYIRMEQLVTSLFEDFLDVTEESDNGKVFHPTYISSCRVMKVEPLNKLLTELKATVAGT
jgi:3'-phosphoadenosine 5'-phosphosulfate sulfotransferase (PAPS reductase)/FAD synthetase